MEFLEKDLEDIIYNALLSTNGASKLNKKGLESFYQKPYVLKRQLKIGNYGVCDLITLDRRVVHKNEVIENGTLTLYELKKGEINNSTLIQSLRYIRGIINYLSKRNSLKGYNINIVLIGRSINMGDWIYSSLLYGTSKIQVETYKYSYGLDGLEFDYVNLCNYKLTHEGF